MDWNALRAEFPVTRRWAFFDHAAVAPLSGPAQGVKSSRKRAKTRAIKEVAHYLGNTPAVARSSYIDPRVFDRFDGGLTIAGALPELGEVETWPDLRGDIEEAVLDLIERDTDSDAIEKAGELADGLAQVAA